MNDQQLERVIEAVEIRQRLTQPEQPEGLRFDLARLYRRGWKDATRGHPPAEATPMYLKGYRAALNGVPLRQP